MVYLPSPSDLAEVWTIVKGRSSGQPAEVSLWHPVLCGNLPALAEAPSSPPLTLLQLIFSEEVCRWLFSVASYFCRELLDVLSQLRLRCSCTAGCLPSGGKSALPKPKLLTSPSQTETLPEVRKHSSTGQHHVPLCLLPPGLAC